MEKDAEEGNTESSEEVRTEGGHDKNRGENREKRESDT